MTVLRPVRRAKPQTRLYHATMQVTRLEEWCVEAASAEDARALLAAGAGHRCQRGDALHVDIAQMHDEDNSPQR